MKLKQKTKQNKKKNNKKLSKIFRIGIEKSVYWNEYKIKSQNKNTTNQSRCFLQQTINNTKKQKKLATG